VFAEEAEGLCVSMRPGMDDDDSAMGKGGGAGGGYAEGCQLKSSALRESLDAFTVQVR
jgi:hypothetical protein